MQIGKRKFNIRSGRFIFTALIAIFFVAGAIAAYNIITTEASYAAAQSEYAELRQLAPVENTQPPATKQDSELGSDPDTVSTEHEVNTETMPDLSEINPDYIGWIRIEGTSIDYPVVQCPSNVKYLNTTFMGDRNPSGTIFMDSQSMNGFFGFAMLHGHNMRDGTMFAGLNRYLESGHLEAHPEIIIITPHRGTLIYSIFDVKLTTVNDTIFTLFDEDQETIDKYFAELGIEDSSGVLILSTCTSGHRNERLLILAERQQP